MAGSQPDYHVLFHLVNLNKFLESFPKKRIIWVGLAGLATISLVLVTPIPGTGLIHSYPDEDGSVSVATGTYIGEGMVLTNWHVLKTLRSRQEYMKLPLWNEHIYNFELPIEWIIFTDKSIDLAIGKIPASPLDWLKVDHKCLSHKPVQAGEVLTIISSPLGLYPPIPAMLIVTDPTVQLRLDLDPLVREEKRYSAISFATRLQTGQEARIESGSSGGAIINSSVELVGLLWTRYFLPDGSKEVLVTPVSAWLPLLADADIAPKYKQYILAQVCT